MPSAGDPGARLAVVGLAPGRRGANRTGAPFDGDHAGLTLQAALRRHGFADDGAPAAGGAALRDCLVTNAVRCAPPGNRPTTDEIARCRPHLTARLAAMPRLAAVVALGRIAHDAVLRALGERPAAHPFAHGAVTRVGGISIHASYHCSRLNTNTGRLTPQMFDAVFAAVRRRLDEG